MEMRLQDLCEKLSNEVKLPEAYFLWVFLNLKDHSNIFEVERKEERCQLC
jgi:hypothetical protein